MNSMMINKNTCATRKNMCNVDCSGYFFFVVFQRRKKKKLIQFIWLLCCAVRYDGCCVLNIFNFYRLLDCIVSYFFVHRMTLRPRFIFLSIHCCCCIFRCKVIIFHFLTLFLNIIFLRNGMNARFGVVLHIIFFVFFFVRS